MKVHRVRNIHVVDERELHAVAYSAVNYRPGNVVLECPRCDDGIVCDTDSLFTRVPLQLHPTFPQRWKGGIEPAKCDLVLRCRASDRCVTTAPSLEERAVELAVRVVMAAIIVAAIVVTTN
jgi:hypothetical protein